MHPYNDPGLSIRRRSFRSCVRAIVRIVVARSTSGVHNEQSDGPVVPRPSSRLVGMLIVSRADRDAIRRRAAGRNQAYQARECMRKGKGHRCVKLRVSSSRDFPERSRGNANAVQFASPAMQLRCATRARGNRRRALRQCIKLNGCDRWWIKIKLLASSGVRCTNSIINKSGGGEGSGERII